MRILITGAAGGVGTLLRPRLARQGRVLRLLDIAPIEAGPGEEAVTADITDPKAMAEAMDGVDAVLHLGGHSLERAWEDILHVNIHGTYVVLEAARRAGYGTRCWRAATTRPASTPGRPGRPLTTSSPARTPTTA